MQLPEHHDGGMYNNTFGNMNVNIYIQMGDTALGSGFLPDNAVTYGAYLAALTSLANSDGNSVELSAVSALNSIRPSMRTRTLNSPCAGRPLPALLPHTERGDKFSRRNAGALHAASLRPQAASIPRAVDDQIRRTVGADASGSRAIVASRVIFDHHSVGDSLSLNRIARRRARSCLSPATRLEPDHIVRERRFSQRCASSES